MSARAATIRFAFLIIAGGLAAGCATTERAGSVRSAPDPLSPQSAPAVQRPPPADPRRSPATVAAGIAAKQVGSPYRYGGSSPAGFDCSGLVHYAYGRAGIRTPRTTGELWRSLSPVPRNRLAVGDVLFFDIEGKMSHVGLYLGNGRFVHAPSSGRHVSIARLDDGYYGGALIRAGRL